MDGVICDERVTALSIHCKYIIIGSIVFLNGGNGFAKMSHIKCESIIPVHIISSSVLK